jgi:uncharacterized protein
MRLSHLWLALAVLAAAGCGDGAGGNRAASQPAKTTAPLPALTGRVVDRADLLPTAREAALTARLAELERRTANRFVVVTVETLNGEAIEDFGLRLGNGWGIGRKDENDGALLIVAPNERKVRIEVGRGLERILTDRICSDIIQRDILPPFREGRMAEGIEAGAAAVTQRLTDAVQPMPKAA